MIEHGLFISLCAALVVANILIFFGSQFFSLYGLVLFVCVYGGVLYLVLPLASLIWFVCAIPLWLRISVKIAGIPSKRDIAYRLCALTMCMLSAVLIIISFNYFYGLVVLGCALMFSLVIGLLL